MTASILLKDLAEELELTADDPKERFVITGVSLQKIRFLIARLINN